MKKKLVIRLITALIIAAVMIPLIFVRDTVIFPVFFAIVSFCAAYEVLKCTGLLKKFIISVPTFVFCTTGPIFAYIYDFGTFGTLTFSFIALYLLFLAVEYTMSAAKDDSVLAAGHKSLSSVCITAFFAMYVYCGFSSLVLLQNRFGFFWTAVIFVIAYTSDTFAYLIGTKFGKHKMIPRVSPNKTFEGAIAGIVAAIVFTFVWYFLYNLIFDEKIKFFIPLLLILAVFGTLCSMLGDLLMSALKRSYGISDFSRLLPGHGGILDRFDSVLAISIIMCALLNLIEMIKG